MSPNLAFEPAWQREALVLMHFLWQGFLVATMLPAVLWLFRVRKAPARYTLSLLAFLAMAACPIVTWTVLDGCPATDVSTMPTSRQVPSSSLKRQAPSSLAEPSGRSRSYVVEAASVGEPTSGRTAWAWASTPVRFARAHQPHLLAAWALGVVLLSIRRQDDSARSDP
jgi:hypothetical protein